MSILYSVTPAVTPAQTDYTNAAADYDRQGTTDPSASSYVTAAVAAAQGLNAMGFSVDSIDATSYSIDEDYSTGERVQLYRYILAAVVYSVGDGYEALIDPGADTNFPDPNALRLYSGISRDAVPSPTWEASSMPEMRDRLAAITGFSTLPTLYPIMGDITPPDPAAFWTQFSKAVEVI